MADLPVSSFTMRGARIAISRGLNHIEEQVDAIERAVVENSGLVFDLAKTLVESTCRTILSERRVPWNDREDLPRLFQKVRYNLPVLPPEESQASAVRDSITRIIGGLSGTIQAISELRNQLSFASHGGDRPRPSMEITHAILAAQSADTIVGFLYQIHTTELTTSIDVESSPARDYEFDSFVDAQHETVRVLDLEFTPSDILFQMEPESYRILLAEFVGQTSVIEERE